MKTILVNPVKDSLFGMVKFPPLGLGYLATALRKEKHEVLILDCVKDRLDFRGFRKFIERENPQAVGINTWSLTLKSVIKSLDIVKEVNPKIITIIGGPHPSAVPDRVFSDIPYVDFAFKGEAEIGLPMLLKKIENGDRRFEEIPGLVWKDDHAKVHINEQCFLEDLDSLGFPSWDLIHPEEYYQPGSLISKDTACIISTRGCPYQCTFCSVHTITGRKLRHRSIGHIMEEIKFFVKNYRTKTFVLPDENFTFFRNFVIEFCNAVLSEGFKLNFFFPNGIRLDTLDMELLILMKRTGFGPEIAVGIESGSDRILRLMKKNLSKEKIKEKVSLLNEMGFRPIGYFILGFPGETEQEIYETIRFSLELKLYKAGFTPFLPLPGTEAYNYLLKSQELPSDFDFSTLGTDKVTYAPKGMTISQLNSLRKKAILKFHLRPHVLYQFISDYNTFRFGLTKFINIFLRRRNAIKK